MRSMKLILTAILACQASFSPQDCSPGTDCKSCVALDQAEGKCKWNRGWGQKCYNNGNLGPLTNKIELDACSHPDSAGCVTEKTDDMNYKLTMKGDAVSAGHICTFEIIASSDAVTGGYDWGISTASGSPNGETVHIETIDK